MQSQTGVQQECGWGRRAFSFFDAARQILTGRGFLIEFRRPRSAGLTLDQRCPRQSSWEDGDREQFLRVTLPLDLTHKPVRSTVAFSLYFQSPALLQMQLTSEYGQAARRSMAQQTK